MSIIDRERLRGIKTFPSLIKYLRDELDWPIEAEDFDELTFDYEPEELGLDARTAAKIEYIKQLRPLPGNQPWGIFFIKFEPKRLPVVVLRRILRSLVIKKRQSANRAEQATWNMHDLLFISAYGENDQRQITFSHFADNPETCGLPSLRVLGWDDADTALHIDYVHDELHKKLCWPEDFADLVRCRETWSSAFTIRHREVVNTSKQLALRLAELARIIRKRVNAILAVESDKGPLRKLMTGFKDALINDLSEGDFADMYAQTIAYGLLAARVANPTGGTADDFAAQMPLTNPFLKELMETFINVGAREGKAGSGTDIDFDELGVSEVVELLDDANMEAVLRDFGDRNPQEDPVIHFYELFLKEYDPKEKVKRGIFYTPRPVVSFIVRSVDELLCTDFGLEDGLADTTTWGEMVERHEGLEIPDGTEPGEAFVQILDPATGTGTFLVEVIDLIHKTMVEKWKAQRHREKNIEALWNEYVPKHLLPRLHGYELLMAPYAVAHMKIGLKLYETGYRFGSDERARVYLTNALEPASDKQLTLDFLPALAHEAQAVNEIKREQRFTVIVANPPYANYSANLTVGARALVDKYRLFAGIPIRERNQLQFERNLQDDFVKFIAIAEDEIVKSGAGVLGYITNATMLASTSLRGMREHLLREFTLLHELHLHGGVNEIADEAQQDQNVFEIAQAVGIHAYARRYGHVRGVVRFCELWGPRVEKYAYLASESSTSTKWEPVTPDPENCAFVPQQETDGHAMVRLPDVFVQFGAGIKTNRDKVAIAFSRAELLESVGAFAPDLVSRPSVDKCVQPVLYRPFDERLIFYHEEVVASRSLPTMQHVLAGPNVGLIASSTWTTPDRFSVDVSRTMVEMKTGTHDRGTTYFPLYRYERIFGGRARKVHNLHPDFVAKWERYTSVRLDTETRSDRIQAASLEDLFRWIYAICYSHSYRRRFRALLAQGFPIVLFPKRLDLLKDVARLGGELFALHLMESPKLDDFITTYTGPKNPEVGRVGWSDGTVWLDAAKTSAHEGHRATKPGTIGFHGVPEEVWNFHIGGYQVCEKWVKDRQAKAGKNPRPGRVLTDEDIAHYQKIIVALNETIRLMQEIDEVIEKHGGWPDAFAEGVAS